MAAISFVLFYTLVEYNSQEKNEFGRTTRGLSFSISDILFSVVCFVSILSFLLIPSTNQPLQTNWVDIQLAIWLKFFAAVFLTCFFPGYVIMRLVDQKKEIRGIARTLFAFMLSLLSISLLSYGLIVVKLSFSTVSMLIVTFNSLVLIVNFLIGWKNKNPAVVNQIKEKTLSHSYVKILLLLLVFISCVSIFSVEFIHQPFIRGDLWRVLPKSFMFLNDTTTQSVISNYQTQFFSPYFLQLFLAAFITLSGFSAINALMLLTFFAALLPLSFFVFAFAFFKRRKHAIVSTVVFTLFSGFGWIYVLFMKINAGELLTEFDSNVIFNVVQEAGDYTLKDFWYPAGIIQEPGIKTYLIGFISLMLLLYVLWQTKPSLKKKFLITALVVMGFLFHVQEILVFIIAFLPVISILLTKNWIDDFCSLLAGLLIVIFIDFLCPIHYYADKAILGIFCLTISSLFYLKRKRLNGLFNSIFDYLNHKWLKILIITSIILFYFASFFVLVSYPPYPEVYVFSSRYAYAYPLHYYPLRLGIVGILAIIGISSIRLTNSSRSKFLILLSISLFIFGVGTSLMNTYFSSGFYEYRIVFYFLPIPLSLVVGGILVWAFTKLSKRTCGICKINPKPISGIVLGVIIVMGSMSTLLSVETWMVNAGPWAHMPTTISEDEIAAIDFLKNNSATVRTVSLSELSLAEIYLVGAFPGTSPTNYVDFFSIKYPENLFLISTDTQYVYVTERDLDLLKKSQYRDNFFFNHLTPYLSPVYQNSEAEIYELPSFHPPTSSETGYVSSRSVDTRFLPSLFTLALSDYSYDQVVFDDSNLFNKSVLVLPADFSSSSDWIPFSSSGNFIQNGSFENGEWEGVLVITQDEAVYGQHSVKLAANASNTGGIWSNFVDSTNFDQFTLSVFVKIPEIKNPSFFGALYFYNSSRQLLSTKNHIDWLLLDSPNSDFVRYNCTLRVSDFPEGTAYVKVRFRWWNEDKNPEGVAYLDGLQLNVGSAPLPWEPYEHFDLKVKQLLNDFTDWIENGGRLIVYGARDYGYFLNLTKTTLLGSMAANEIVSHKGKISFPDLTSPILSLDPSSKILANYSYNNNSVTPFAFISKYGKGEIVYLNAEPFFSLLQSDERETKKATFGQLRSLLPALNLSFLSEYIGPERYPMGNRWITQYPIWGLNNVNCTGRVEVVTNSLDTSCFRELSGNEVTVIYQKGTKEDFNNASIVNLKLFEQNLTFDSQDIQIFSSEDRYFAINFNGFNLTLELINNSVLNLDVNDQKIDFRNCTITLENSNEHVFLLKQPEIEVDGLVVFGKVSIPSLTGISQGTQPYTLQGTTKFRLDFSDESIFFGSDIQREISPISLLFHAFTQNFLPAICVVLGIVFIVLYTFRDFATLKTKISKSATKSFPRLTVTGLTYNQLIEKPEILCDIGCGKGAFIKKTHTLGEKLNRTQLIGLDLFKTDLLKSKKIYTDVIRCDVRYLPIKRSSVDVVLALELIKHLEKDDGLVLLNDINEIATKQIILSTPVGWNPQSEYDGNPWQEHKSKWDPEEFLVRGFNVKGITGIKNMYSKQGKFRFNKKTLKPFFYLLMLISQFFTYKNVHIAYEMICIKNLV
jgi:hypothetical protein